MWVGLAVARRRTHGSEAKQVAAVVTDGVTTGTSTLRHEAEKQFCVFLTTLSRDGANQFIFFMSQLERARMKCVNRVELLHTMERIRFFFLICHLQRARTQCVS